MSAKSKINGREVEFVGTMWVYVDDGEAVEEAATVEKQQGKFYTGGHCVQPKDKPKERKSL